jgi:hypothetical protein
MPASKILKRAIIKEGGLVQIGLKLSISSSKRLGDFRTRSCLPIVEPERSDHIRLFSKLPASKLPLYEEILTTFAARSPFEVTVESPVKTPSYRDHLIVICPVSSIDLTEIYSYLSKAFGDVIVLSRLTAFGGRYPTTVTQMNLLRPFEPCLVISPTQSPEKAAQIFQSAEEEFKSGLRVVKVIGIGMGVQKDRRTFYWKLFPFLGKT